MRTGTIFYKSVLGVIAGLVINALSVNNVSAQSFSRISSSTVVSDIGGFLGTAWGDYDNDGKVDLFVANFNGRNQLFHNNGNGSFTKITMGEIATDLAGSYSGSWGDYDNDGDLDLFVANMSSVNFLYRNDGNILTRVKEGGIVADKGAFQSGSWGDYDNDGYLDLFVANDGQKNFLYHNNRDGTFSKITSGPVVNDIASSVVGLWADYDNDGDLDLYVVNGTFSMQKNALYRNESNGIFTKITEGAIVNDVEGSTGGSWGDYDNDGDLDLYICNSVNNARNSLYKNNGDGTFQKPIKNEAIIADMGHSVGCSWIDYDNDGDLDLYVVNVFGATNQLYQNNGNGAFSKITSGEIVNDVSLSFGCSWADFDNDGDQDVIVTNGGFNGQLFRNFFYRNNGNNNKWISIQCRGIVSNASAIGAVVRVKASINGNAVWQMQQISGQNSYLGQNSLDAEFGLGDATAIDSVVINWPSGKKQVLTNVATNQFLKIEEASTVLAIEEQNDISPSAGYRLSDNYPNPFNPETTIEYELSTAGSVRLEVYNLLGQKIKTLVDQNQVAGAYRVAWNGNNEFGEQMASGIYLYRIATNEFQATKRMLLHR